MCPAVGAGKIRVGPSGKSAKRCQWQRKRAGFKEVPRLADTTVTGNRLARRWATAGPYESVTRGAMGGRPQGSPLRRVTRGRGTAGRCRHRPLRRFDKKVPVKNPPVTASPCQSPLGKGPRGRGMRIATGALRPRNDSVFVRSRYKAGGRTGSFAPTGSFWFYLHRKIYISGAKEEYL